VEAIDDPRTIVQFREMWCPSNRHPQVPVGDGSGFFLARVAGMAGIPWRVDSLLDSLFGALAGGGLLFLLGEIYFRLRHKEGMGFGDVKMMAMAGAFLGVQRALLTIMVGALLGSLIGAAIISIGRKGSDFELPFGTFLGAAALLVVFVGSPALAWYRSLLFV